MVRLAIGSSLFCVCVSILLTSCAPKEASLPSVDQLYREYELQPSMEKAEVYLDTLDQFIRNNIESPDLIQPYLVKGKDISMTQGLLSRTPGYLLPLLRLYPNLADRTAHLLSLGDVMYTLRKGHAASIIYKELLNQSASDPEVQKKANLIDSIAQVEPDYVKYLFDQILINPDELGVNKAASLRYVDAVEALALASPDNETLPGHLYTAAEVARSMRTFPKAMSLYDWLIDDYPTHEKAPPALFIKGFILEQDYKRDDEAKEVYTRFLKEYPDHDMAESAQFLLNNLGKSDEEILKEIEAKKTAN